MKADAEALLLIAEIEERLFREHLGARTETVEMFVDRLDGDSAATASAYLAQRRSVAVRHQHACQTLQ